jgi:Ca2+-binding RTX toxin-like protein
VTGSPLGDSLFGDFLDTLNGACGDDLIDGANAASGGDGDDSFMNISSIASGGPGDDRFIQFTASGGIEGGPGTDSWEVDFDQATLGVGNTSLAFTVNANGLTLDIADDGMPPTSVSGSGLEQMFVTLLRQGTQSYDGSAFPGTQHVRGVAGPDTIVGGAFDDALYGGSGDDTVTGGAGGDVLGGGLGNDVIQARDGVADRIDCGDGTDTAVVDATDVVAGCETVQLPPPPPPVVPETSKISGKKTWAKPAVAKFGFSSPTAGATFQCKLDKGKWKTCTSKHKVKTKKLKTGKHTLRVRAVLAGTVDPTPSVKKFKVTG